MSGYGAQNGIYKGALPFIPCKLYGFVNCGKVGYGVHPDYLTDAETENIQGGWVDIPNAALRRRGYIIIVGQPTLGDRIKKRRKLCALLGGKRARTVAVKREIYVFR